MEKTEGSPFFIEEIVQALHEQGFFRQSESVGTHGHALLSTDFHIPATVQGVLTARIDRLVAEEKDLLQTLAVLGKKTTEEKVVGADTNS